jgi:hypothetical protein
MQHDFADELRGPDPRDRFPWFPIAILAAAVILIWILWGAR